MPVWLYEEIQIFKKKSNYIFQLLLTILALAASPIYAAEDALTEKKVDKRGLLGLGYGGYGGYYGLNGYGGT